MNNNWKADDIIKHFTLLLPEIIFLGSNDPHNHLGKPHNQQHGALNVNLEIHYTTETMRQQKMEPVRICHSSMEYMYWTPEQMLAHHKSNGCNMNVGDLFASGTVSGSADDGRGCMLELSWRCTNPYQLPSWETRCDVENGDEVILSDYCEQEGFRRMGLGVCQFIVI